MFLVIILVPVLTVSALFVDAGKVRLGKAMAESAGDLTLNTALTDYDTQLKDLYGLLATAQNTDDLFSKLEDYYRTCIISSGVNENDAEPYVAQIMAQLGIVSKSNDVADIMNMQLIDFSAEKLQNANLANSTILKKQIVDFMKYRAPINTGLSFVSALKSFSTLSKQTELVEKKQAYYEAQKDVLSSLKSAWEQIAYYNNTQIVQRDNYVSNIKSAMNTFKSGGKVDGTEYKGYETYNKWTVMDLYKTNGLFDYSCSISYSNVEYLTPAGKEIGDVVSFKYNGYSYTTFADLCNSKKWSNDKLPTESEIKNAIDSFYKSLQSAEACKADIKNTKPSAGDYSLQFMVKAQDYSHTNVSNYTSNMGDVFSAYQRLKAMWIWLDENAAETSSEVTETETDSDDNNEQTSSSTDIKDTYYERKDDNNTVNNKPLSWWYEEVTNKFNSLMTNFSLFANEFTNDAKQGKTIYDQHYPSTNSQLSGIAGKVNGYIEDLTNAKNYLDTAIKHLSNAKTQLEGKAASAKSQWNNVADDKAINDTSMAKQDKAEIGQLDTYLNSTNIQKMINRLTNIKTNIETLITQIQGYKFDGKFIGDIGNYSSLESTIGDKIGDSTLKDVPVNETRLVTTASNYWNGAWESGNVKDDWVKQSGQQPNLTQDQLALYSYMQSKFGNVDISSSDNSKPSTVIDKEDEGNGKTLYNNIKSQAKSSADSTSSGADGGQASSSTKDHNITGDTLPSKLKVSNSTGIPSGTISTNIDSSDNGNGAAGDASSALGKLFGNNFLSAVEKGATDLRDKLYIADYAMSMFTYDTIETEYNNKNGKDKSEEVKAGTLLSLTKNDLSKANNYAYGAEVEYIIYGGTNTSNLVKAYGSIYAIRLGFNLVYAFATSEIRESALAIATPISAATLGIIPVPLIQAVIIVGIACCESAIDLVDLRDGKKVPLYKTNETWNCSISGLIHKAKGLAGDVIKKTSGEIINKGVDKLNELLDMSDEQLNQLIDKKTGDIEESVRNAYDQIVTNNANEAIQQLTTLVNTAVQNTLSLDVGETYAAKKSQMKKWVKTQITSWGNQFTGGDIASTVKREASNLIANNSDTFIDGLFDVVEKEMKKSGAGETINSVLNGSKTVEDGVDSLGGEIMTYVQRIRTSITDTVVNGSQKVKNAKEELIKKIKSASQEGADKLKETINNEVNNIFGNNTVGGSGDDNGTGLASFFSFRYSDYLRLFLLIGLYTNESQVILRIGDVVQTNMAKQITNNNGYQLQKGAVYVNVKATVQVKPTLLAVPWLLTIEGNTSENTGWYTLSYDGIAGY